MPPEITAGPPAAAGLMPLVGTPGMTAAGKPPAGPPGSISPSISTLFASLLAQSGAPTPKPPVLKEAVLKEAVLKEAVLKEAVLKEAVQTAAAPTEPPAPSGSKRLNFLPATVPNVKQPVLKQTTLEQTASESLKTMDTLPDLPAPPMEKAKVKASELPLHKASADTPGASSMPAPIPVQVSALPSLVPPVLFLTTASSAAVPMSVPAAKAPPTGQSVPLLHGSVGTPSLNAAPAVGLSLPRTFALTAPQSVPQPLLPSVPQSVEAAPPAGALMPPASAAMPVTTGTASLSQPISRPASNGKSSAAAAVQLSAASPAPAGLISALPDAVEIVQVAPPLPAATPLPLQTASPNIVPSAPVTAEAVTNPMPTVKAGQSQAPPVAPAEKTPGTVPENTLKSPAGNADNNTRTIEAAVPAAAKAIPEKHGEAQADPVLLENGTLTGTQAAVKVAAAAPSESKPLSAADRAEIVHQVAGGVEAMPLTAKPGAAQQMSLQLHPKDWGSLQVSVTVAPGAQAGSVKTVTAHIVAETPQVKAALESQTGALNQALRASGLHLEHLTVSVKPPDAKIAEVKPASQSASTGMSSGQGQQNTNGQAGTNTGNSQAQAGQSSASFAGSSHAGNSQNGRQGQPPAFAAAAEPEPEETLHAALPVSRAWGRIDTRA